MLLTQINLIVHKEKNKNLRVLRLAAEVKDSLIQSITENLQNLTELTLITSGNFKRSYLHNILSSLVNLEVITLECDLFENDLEFDYNISTLNIGHLRKLRNIRFKGFKNCPEIDIIHLIQCRDLQTLVYWICDRVRQI